MTATLPSVGYHDRVTDLVGGTPLVRLRRVAAHVAPPVLAKVEYLNPGGSVKDRIALRMIEDAEASGRLRPGGTVVEGTSGNTGVGLAMVAQSKGYRCVLTCPDKVSSEKINVLRALGAEVIVCPAGVPPEHPDSYRSVSSRLAEEIPGAWKADQYANANNPAAHYEATGPEIWEQTAGTVTHFVAGVGTGGTLVGAGQFLKEASSGRVVVVGADPDGSVIGGARRARPYAVEGVGQPVLPAVYDPRVADEIVTVDDADALAMTRRLAREESLLVGPSCGMAVVAAVRVAGRLPADAVVVTVLPDSGRGYLSKVFDDGWMARQGFLDGPAAGGRFRDLLDGMPPLVVAPAVTAGEAHRLLTHSGGAFAVVSAAPPPVRVGEVLGVVDARSIAEAVARGAAAAGVEDIGYVPLEQRGAGEPTDDAPLPRGAAALVVEAGVVSGVVGGSARGDGQ